MPEIFIGDKNKNYVEGVALDLPGKLPHIKELIGNYDPLKDALVRDLFVVRPERYQGIGRRLLKQFELQAKIIGAENVAVILNPERGFQKQLEGWFSDKGYSIMKGHEGKRNIAIKHLT